MKVANREIPQECVKTIKLNKGWYRRKTPCTILFIMVMIMLVNNDFLKKEELNSFAHKVRAIVFNNEEKLYITDMNSSFNLLGGRVEKMEELSDSLIRELKEELGVRVFTKDIKYIGEFIFWHKGFPGEKSVVNRENKVDLFLVTKPQELKINNVKLTNYEKHYNFKLLLKNLEEIDNLIKYKGNNPYKKFTDVELKTLVNAYLEYRKEG